MPIFTLLGAYSFIESSIADKNARPDERRRPAVVESDPTTRLVTCQRHETRGPDHTVERSPSRVSRPADALGLARTTQAFVIYIFAPLTPRFYGVFVSTCLYRVHRRS